MGEWGYVTFFRTQDLDALERAIARVCTTEGLEPTLYAPRVRETWDRMQYGTGATSDRWSVAIGRGKQGWCVARTAPFELLAEPAPGGEHRIGTIARELRCEALHVSLYDGTAMVVVQAMPDGEVTLRGYTTEGLIFHGVPLDEERAEPRIDRIEVPASVHEALAKYLADGYEELVVQLADPSWHTVGVQLVDGAEIPEARVSAFVRPAGALPPPLRVKLAVEEHPLGSRYVLDDAVWMKHGSITAADAERGAAFVRKVATWLNVDAKLDPGVPLGEFCTMEPPAEAATRPGMQPMLVTVGDGGIELLFHLAPERGFAEIEARSAHQSNALVKLLARALAGERASKTGNPVYRGFRRVVAEPSPRAVGTFAGERLVAAWWRRHRSAVLVEGHPVFELPGLCTAIAATPRHAALALVTPRHVTESPKYGLSQGYGQDDPTTLVLLDLETLATRELLRSDDHLTLGFTRLAFDGDVLGVEAERDRTKIVVLLDGDGRRELPGEFRAWLRAVLARDLEVDGLYERWDVPMFWAGPRAVVVDGERLGVLDLDTRERRPLFDATGLEPVACSSSGERCLACIEGGHLYVGSR